MIVVTGTPRSGTSMLMQTLGILGIPLAGEQFSETNLPKNNPKGYWELPKAEVFTGVKSHKYKGMAVKLMANELIYTKPSFISKILFITRYQNYAVKSYLKCLHDNSPYNVKVTRVNCDKLYEWALECAEKYIKNNPSIPCIKFDYKEFLKNTENEISRLSGFLDIKVNLKEAIANIDTKKGW
jgi:hypothetical protein